MTRPIPGVRYTPIRISNLDYWLLLLSLALLRLPIAFGYRNALLIRWLPALPFLISVLLKLGSANRQGARLRADRRTSLGFLLFGAIWAVALSRTALQDYSFDTFYIFGKLATLGIVCAFALMTLTLNRAGDPEQIRPYRPILYACGLYISLNLLFHVIGLDSRDPIYLARYPAQMLATLGLSLDRVQFPMSNGINAFGIVAGGVLVGLIPLAASESRPLHRAALACMLAACGAVVLLTDSRGALLSSALILAIIYLPPRLRSRAIWIPFLTSVLPAAIMILAPTFLSDHLGWLSRPGGDHPRAGTPAGDTACVEYLAQSSGALSNRPLIWRVALDELQHPGWIHLVGYGFRGHFVSGLSARYSCLFSSYAMSALASTHNIWLQTVIDVGYLGLAISLWLLGLLITRLFHLHATTRNPVFQGMLAVVLYIVASGALEATLSPDFSELFILFLMIAIVVISATSQGVAQLGQQTGTVLEPARPG